ncbi:Uncharacterized protein DBV15_00618 [Temnothorax longispinosus]|uniref:Uncharacterized protein n=1 Tax=Temnothorax longispinosus TaxID=300112 RepID=A0A4S2KXW9_9HYME|nr:Uncharacterized protein DBV15_00618 [Temnothorax longispinosus]
MGDPRINLPIPAVCLIVRLDDSTRRTTIAEGSKVSEKEGSSQLLRVVCRANSQQIFDLGNVGSSRYNQSAVNNKFISDEHIKPMSVNQNVRTSIPADRAGDKSAGFLRYGSENDEVNDVEGRAGQEGRKEGRKEGIRGDLCKKKGLEEEDDEEDSRSLD